MGDAPTSDFPGRILIVDDDALARWSLVEYLQRWATVIAVAEMASALAVIARGEVTTLILSDALDPGDVETIQTAAEDQFAGVRTILTVTSLRAAKRPRRRCKCLEKPFALEDLARLLKLDLALIQAER